VAREVFDMIPFWHGVEALDNKVAASTQLEMLIEARKLVERTTRWLVRRYSHGIDIEAATSRFKPCAENLADACPGVLSSDDRHAFSARVKELKAAGVPYELATRTAQMPRLLSVFDIMEIANATGRSVETVTETYFAVSSVVALTWLRERVLELPRANRWQALARAALRDDLYSIQRELTQKVLENAPEGTSADAAIEAWREHNAAAVDRVRAMLDDIRASRTYDTTTLPVALREVRNLIRDDAS
jgi:glutamate dehydrogenase